MVCGNGFQYPPIDCHPMSAGGLFYYALYDTYICLNILYMSYKVHHQCMQDIGHRQYQLITHNQMQLKGKTLGRINCSD